MCSVVFGGLVLWLIICFLKALQSYEKLIYPGRLSSSCEEAHSKSKLLKTMVVS